MTGLEPLLAVSLIGSTAVSAVNQLQLGEQAEAQGRFAASQSFRSAIFKKQQSRAVDDETSLAVSDQIQEGQFLDAERETGIASSGVVSGSGSARDLARQHRLRVFGNVAQVQRAGNQRRVSLLQASAADINQGRFSLSSGKNARRSRRAAALGEVFSGTAQALSLAPVKGET